MKVGIVGPGRAGVGLALALRRAGVTVLGLHGRRRKRLPRGLSLSVGGEPPWLPRADVVLLAVRDDSLGPLVNELKQARGRRAGQAFLHLSGALPARVLRPLKRGARLGAMHPLMTVSDDPRRAAAHFRGATFALEGDRAALRAARALVKALGGVPVVIRPGARARYHAGAVFASNYLTVALATAEELLVRAGFALGAARRALGPLARASLDNVSTAGPRRALTGPIARGDVATVRRHLASLPPATRKLYRALGVAAVDVARRAGLPRAVAARLRRVLR